MQIAKKRGMAKHVAKRGLEAQNDCFALSFLVTFFD